MGCSAKTALVTALSSLTFISLISCGGGGSSSGGGGGTAGSIVSGTVTAPSGVVAFLRQPSIEELFESTAYAAITGSATVQDGTIVQLGRIAKTAPFSFSSLATTTTASGRYSFNLTNLGLNFTNDLLIRVVGSGNQEMRAFVTNPSVDLNPGSELAVRFVLERITAINGATLDRFTLQEVNDLSVSLNLLIGVRTIIGGTDLENAIGAIRTAVLADATLLAYISDATNVGQTSQGPGDQGNHFPANVGSAWGYRSTRSETGGPMTTFNTGRTISGSRLVAGITETVVYETNPSNSGIPEEDYLVKDGAGVARRGTSDSTDFLTPQLAPYHEIRFPLQKGKTFEQLNKVGLTFPEDVDGDGRNEIVNIISTTQVVGFEMVTTPVGSFPNAARIETQLSTTVLLSGGGSVPVSGVETWWLVPNIGLVKRTTTAQALGITQTDSEELISYSVGGHNEGTGTSALNIAQGLEQANSGETRPGRPGLATDGTNYLLVSCRMLGTSQGIFGVSISGGVPGEPFPISSISNADCGAMGFPTVAYDGSNYLVVSNRGDGFLQGTRVSPSGVVLDDPGFPITTTSPQPSIAFDGTNYLIILTRYNGLDHDIYGVRVTPSGQILSEFPISLASGTQFLPSVAFDGTNYLVVWTDQRNGPASGNYDIYAARVSPSGNVFDPTGIPIASTGNGEQYPHVVFDGTNYLVVWESILVPASGPPQVFEIRGTRVTQSGTLMDGLPNSGGIAINTAPGVSKQYPSVAIDGSNLLVAWAQGNFGPGGDERGIFGVRVSRGGQIIEGGPPPALGIKLSSEFVPIGGRFVYPSSLGNSFSTVLSWISLGGTSDTTKEIQGSITFH